MTNIRKTQQDSGIYTSTLLFKSISGNSGWDHSICEGNEGHTGLNLGKKEKSRI